MSALLEEPITEPPDYNNILRKCMFCDDEKGYLYRVGNKYICIKCVYSLNILIHFDT